MAWTCAAVLFIGSALRRDLCEWDSFFQFSCGDGSSGPAWCDRHTRMEFRALTTLQYHRRTRIVSKKGNDG